MENNGDNGNADIYHQTKNRLKAYLESIGINSDISFETIKPKLLNGWVNFYKVIISLNLKLHS